MKVLDVRNVHQALSEGLYILDQFGVERPSRNGSVLMTPWPVVTVYRNPLERVVFWPERDANPFLHLYESLWMLNGREDVAPLGKFSKQISKYSDDGRIFHGAYGYRWRRFFGFDQFPPIIKTLKNNRDDRQCVLQMWAPGADLGVETKDKPCNLTVTLQRGVRDGELNMTVFCRSNDIVWGAYGANAVHFSFLQEYLALAIGCPVGIYNQISVNYHGYLDVLKTVKSLPRSSFDNPYFSTNKPLLMAGSAEETMTGIKAILNDVDRGFASDGITLDPSPSNVWTWTIRMILYAHHLWKVLPAPRRFNEADRILNDLNPALDFVRAAKEWIARRFIKWDMNESSLAWSNSSIASLGSSEVH